MTKLAKAPKGLTDLEARNLAPRAERYEQADAKTQGLRLVVQPSGAKSWAFRYRHDGKAAKLTLGSYPAMTLAEARAAAAIVRGELAKGVDPAADKREAREAARDEQSAVKWDDALSAYLTAHVERNLRPNSRYEANRMLRRECASWNGRRVDSLTRKDVFKVIDTMIARNVPVQANRVLTRLNHAFKWMMSRELIKANPAAGVTKAKEGRARERVLSDEELSLVWRASESLGYPHGLIVRLLILTATRRTEVSDARWDEFDLVKGVWRIPSERSKNKEAHELPLSPLALDILKSLPRFANGFLFNPRNNFAPAKDKLDAAIAELNGGKKIEPWVYHDIRRSVATGLASFGVAIHVTERILNHTGGTFKGIVGVYQRFEYKNEMRAALDRWAAHVERVVSGETGGGNVVELRA